MVLGKVVNHLTKYVTKHEKDMSDGVYHTIKKLMHNNLNAGNSVKTVLQMITGKLLGSRIVSKQETCHYLIIWVWFIVGINLPILIEL